MKRVEEPFDVAQSANPSELAVTSLDARPSSLHVTTSEHSLSQANDEDVSVSQARGAREEPQTKWSVYLRRTRFMVALMLPLLLETFDQTITASAQPHIASSFNRLDLQSWVGTSFVLTSTAFLPLFANIADVWGRFWPLEWSLFLFLLGSSLCTGARNMPMLLAGRGISGVGGAGISTLCRIVIADFKSLDDNNIQSAIIVSLQGAGFIVGPVIGGALSSVSWRYVFGINLPVAVVSLILVFLLLRRSLVGPRNRIVESNNPHEFVLEATELTLSEKFIRVDWVGAALFTLACILILFGLSTGSTSTTSSRWGSPSVISSLAVGGSITVAFLIWEWRLQSNQLPGSPRVYIASRRVFASFQRPWNQYTKNIEAMIPLPVFSSLDVSATYFGAMTGGMVLFGVLYFLSIYFDIVAGYDATKSGIQLLFLAPGLGVGVYLGIFMVKFLRQPKYAVMAGSAVQTIAMGLMSMAVSAHNTKQINVFLSLVGFGIGLTFGPQSLQAQYSLPVEFTAVVVTLNLFFRNIGGTIGLAQLSAVLESKIRTHIESLILSGSISPAEASLLRSSITSLSGSGRGAGVGIDSLPPHLRQIITDAYRFGTRWAFVSLIPWCAAATIPSFFLRNIRERDTEEEAGREGLTSHERGDALGEANNVGTDAEQIQRIVSKAEDMRPKGDAAEKV